MSNGKKQTVVILAEDKSWVQRGDRWSGVFRPGSFPDQAEWWKEDNADVFNTVIIPYYNEWEGHELSDAKKIIDEIPGEITIGIMGHSGSIMGGYPITEITKQRMLRNDLEYMSSSAADIQAIKEFRHPNQPGVVLEPGQAGFYQVEEEKERFFDTYKWYEEDKDLETISKFVKSLKGHKEGKVKEVMVGACRMANGTPNLSYLAEEIGIPVSGQSNASWGTGSVSESKIGDKPNERFFVKGKKAVGVQFTPDRDFHVLQTTSDAEIDKYESENFSQMLGWTRGYDKTLVSKDNPHGRTGYIFEPEKTWHDEKGGGSARMTELELESKELIKERIDITQFQDYFKNEDDYKEFLSDLGSEDLAKYTQKYSPEYSPEGLVMESLLEGEEDILSPVEWTPGVSQIDVPETGLPGRHLMVPETAGEVRDPSDMFGSLLDNFTRGAEAAAEAGGRYGGQAAEGLQEFIMDLVNPEETDLFEEDMP